MILCAVAWLFLTGQTGVHAHERQRRHHCDAERRSADHDYRIMQCAGPRPYRDIATNDNREHIEFRVRVLHLVITSILQVMLQKFRNSRCSNYALSSCLLCSNRRYLSGLRTELEVRHWALDAPANALPAVPEHSEPAAAPLCSTVRILLARS